ncbi:MAG: hypothetical protein LAT75_05640 [Candidatus Cyclonatronum sp.]|uniref:hypothetical protein n=1 Tax=Cyclonatronum sp. TaxID=3024185 RepID=UPI0025BC8CCD|nr:hypothetical protein [Cyclonatronum sp.]MCC5934225.1 hypothetical protein [Balneolales bacterium]MCH8486328.1 hypothetical protein [Cyclonatronum sp.]
MMNRCFLSFFCLSLFAAALLFSCTSGLQENQTLSQLMRERTNQMQLIKSAVEAGTPIAAENTVFTPFAKGDPSRDALREPGVQGQLQAFDSFYVRFLDAPTPENYNIVVQTCISCHERMCPGPLRLVRSLALEEIPEPGFQLLNR